MPSPGAVRTGTEARRAVLAFQPSFHVPKPHAGAASTLKGLARRAGTRVFNGDHDLTALVVDAFTFRPNRSVTTVLLMCDAVLDGVFDERLEQKRRKRDLPERR